MSDEAALVDRARRGDSSAFDRLVEGALPRVLGTARKMLRNDDEAWDAAQEAFLRAWERIRDFKEESLFSSWVCGIVVHLSLDRLRARKRIDPHVELDEAVERRAEGAGPEESAEARQLAAAMTTALQRLGLEERAVFSLHHEAGMKYREIAVRLKIPIGTVMSRLHAARLRLREDLKEWLEETV